MPKQYSPFMNRLIIFAIIFYSCIVIGVCYLLFKTWDIFGFWALLWTILLEVISSLLIGHLVGSRIEKNGIILYKPKEWPKFLNILISLAIGFYLYTIISNPDISRYDYSLGLALLVLLLVLPITYSIYKLIRDRNDFISLTEVHLKYKDNDKSRKFKFSDIATAELSKGIRITFKNGDTRDINTDNMNFNVKDLTNIISDIKAKLPEEKKGEKSDELK